MVNLAKKIIGLDFDGTVSEPIVNVVALLNKRYGKNYTLKDVKEYWYNGLYGITREELGRAYAEVLEEGNVELVDKRIPSIIKELEKSFDICLVTYSFAKEQCIADWLKKHSVELKRVVVAKEKIDLKDAAFFIDDSPYNAIKLSSFGKKVILLKKWHYNYGDDIINGNIIPVSNWGEIRKAALDLL